MTTEENFRPIPDYPHYSVSQLGNIKNKHGRILKPYGNCSGYLKVKLSIEGTKKQEYVHRLVAFVWCQRPDNRSYNEVNHINAIRNDCRSANLEWVSRNLNAAHRVLLKFFSFETV